VDDSARQARGLSPLQRAAVIELGSRGSGGEFDPIIMSSLLTMGFIEIRPEDRRIMLTARGELAYAYFTAPRPPAD
jgi:hypothetical protein